MSGSPLRGETRLTEDRLTTSSIGFAEPRPALEITPTHTEQYERDGYTIVKNGFDVEECDRFIAYMMDLQAGRTSVEGYAPRDPDDWSRLICRNCHHPVGLAWMIDPRLREPDRTKDPSSRRGTSEKMMPATRDRGSAGIRTTPSMPSSNRMAYPKSPSKPARVTSYSSTAE